ncbi:MAG: NAD-dependent dehydratase [Betaproteobacteria bacterium RIFCSPLOWO2_02_FULL_62_17]|nr:MAG: NAD-dependent dehydratase [Betaproteobacteria bacterium RIFCSPLOWO2_02_FULL_62_17]
MSQILVIGGSGFVGSHVVARLVQAGHTVRVATRRRERARQLFLLPTVDVLQADVHDDRALDQLVAGCDAVVNLAGILHSRPGDPYGADFARVHVELPRRITDACHKAGIRRLVHVSALGAKSDAPSEYLRSKAAGEEVLIAARTRIDATVLRPSVVFGPEDNFLNLFSRLQCVLPVMLLACPEAKFQPVHVTDVAECVARCLVERDSIHRSYDLCGPKVYTLAELVRFAGAASGHRRQVIGLPDSLAYLQAWFMEWLPVKLLSRDNLRSMQVPSTCDCEFPFGIHPVSLESTAPAWLAGKGPRTQYHEYRGRAGR